MFLKDIDVIFGNLLYYGKVWRFGWVKGREK